MHQMTSRADARLLRSNKTLLGPCSSHSGILYLYMHPFINRASHAAALSADTMNAANTIGLLILLNTAIKQILIN